MIQPFSILDEDRKMKRNKNEEGGKRSKNSIGFFFLHTVTSHENSDTLKEKKLFFESLAKILRTNLPSLSISHSVPAQTVI